MPARVQEALGELVGAAPYGYTEPSSENTVVSRRENDTVMSVPHSPLRNGSTKLPLR